MSSIVIQALQKKYEGQNDLKTNPTFAKILFQNIDNGNNIQQQEKKTNFAQIDSIQLSGNSYGVEACQFLSKNFINKFTSLKKANLADVFTGRLKNQIPTSLNYLVQGLQSIKSNLVSLDLSHNACGATGIAEICVFLKSTTALKQFRITNVGISPDGGVILGQAFKEAASRQEGHHPNSLQLEVFQAGRNRIENKGILEIAKYENSLQLLNNLLFRGIKYMKTIKSIHLPQNGIKQEGMTSLLTALLSSSKTLQDLDISDNWIKGQAVEVLCELLRQAKSTLQSMNISDSNIGIKGTLSIFQTLFVSKMPKLATLKHNYNEMDSTKAWKICVMQSIESLKQLKHLESKGNEVSKKVNLKLQESAKQAGITYIYDSEDEDEDEDDEENDDQDDPINSNDELNGEKMTLVPLDLVTKFSEMKL